MCSAACGSVNRLHAESFVVGGGGGGVVVVTVVVATVAVVVAAAVVVPAAVVFTLTFGSQYASSLTVQAILSAMLYSLRMIR